MAQTTSDATFVTFTFTSPCEDCATQNSAAGNVYIVDVPSARTPSLTKSPSLRDFNLQVTLKDDRTVYTFPFKSGTSPRAVWRQGATVLQIFFVPGVGNVAATTSETGSPSLPSTTDATSASSNGNGNGHVGDGSTGSAPSARMSSLSVTSAVTPSQSPTPNPTPPVVDPAVLRGPVGQAAVDLSVPESPAFTVLGITPETVIRPTSPRAFATSLLNGVDQNGNFQSGLAMDFVPYLLIAGDDLTLRKYQTSRITRLLARTQFSFATAKGATEDDKSLRLGLGLHMTLWDRGDPRLDQTLLKCLSRLVLPRIIDLNDTAGNERKRQEAQEVNDALSISCREKAKEDNWNASSWIIGAAPSWISMDGQTKNLGWNGGGFWTSVAYGFEGVPGLEKKSQLILHGRYRNREVVPDPATTGAFLSQDSFFLGTRFRTGSPTFNGSFEYTFLRSRINGLKFDNSSRLSVLFERRIAGDTWFNLSLGGETGREDGRNNGFVLTSFKWAFSDRQSVRAPQ
ncbi:MAG TPA: hypothetical protein VF290_00430 [Pyrinomonadaceae bacterium]